MSDGIDGYVDASWQYESGNDYIQYYDISQKLEEVFQSRKISSYEELRRTFKDLAQVIVKYSSHFAFRRLVTPTLFVVQSAAVILARLRIR